MATDDPLSALQTWFKRRVDGQWEHQFGIRIESLDNPGWLISIDVADTEVADKRFDEIAYDGGPHDWLTCRVVKRTFEGYGDVGKLAAILRVFTTWVRA